MRDCAEEKDQFYLDLDCVISNDNGLMMMGDFNASVRERVRGVVGLYGLGRHNSENDERLVSIVTTNEMCICIPFFSKQAHPSSMWYPPDPRSQPSLDYELVKERMRPSILNTRFHIRGDVDSDHRLVVTPIRRKLMKKIVNPRRRQCLM